VIRVTERVRLTEPEAIAEAVREAIGIADEAELSPEDRAVLLPAIFTNAVQRHVVMEQVGLGGPTLAIPQNSH
jgi:hypothetical protein